MKRKSLLLILALMLVLTACGNKGAKDGVAATVDGVEIPQKTFDLYYGIERQRIVAQIGEEGLNQPMDKLERSAGEILRENILNSLISNQVILNAAKDEDLGDIDATVEEQVKMEKEMSGEDIFKENLVAIGLTEEEYKNVLKDNAIVNEFRNKKMEGYEVSQEDKEKFFEENKEAFYERSARHILVETEDEANKVLQRLKDGEDFAELAKELSQDPGSAAQGGDLGFFPQGRMVAEFNDFVFGNNVGDLSDPIKSDFGYHIIEITGEKSTLEDFTEEVEQGAKSQKFVDEMKDLEKKAKIKKIYDVSNEPESILEKLEVEKDMEENIEGNVEENLENQEENSEETPEAEKENKGN
ncbi:peptidylprolyl isomerase [Neofamilia massiliensis]|uniref:peptidylprolyl isomerase n=1 Tax=Neofamilia massiliensis TaxID=1673724 RepID=UPI0006BB68FD|nr:peptidylprolyl isomerase [Neofamilia massiliensis]